MLGHLSGNDLGHISPWVMVLVCGGAAGYWWWALRATIRLAVPWTVPLTAVLLAVSLWTAAAYVVLALDTEHDLPTSIWLRPSLGIYVAASAARSALYAPLVERVLGLAASARAEIDRSEQ